MWRTYGKFLVFDYNAPLKPMNGTFGTHIGILYDILCHNVMKWLFMTCDTFYTLTRQTLTKMNYRRKRDCGQFLNWICYDMSCWIWLMFLVQTIAHQCITVSCVKTLPLLLVIVVVKREECWSWHSIEWSVSNLLAIKAGLLGPHGGPVLLIR